VLQVRPRTTRPLVSYGNRESSQLGFRSSVDESYTPTIESSFLVSPDLHSSSTTRIESGCIQCWKSFPVPLGADIPFKTSPSPISRTFFHVLIFSRFSTSLYFVYPATQQPKSATLFVSSRACILHTPTLVTPAPSSLYTSPSPHPPPHSLYTQIAFTYYSHSNMRDTPSKFIEILDPKDISRMSDSDVRLEDVLADHEAISSRPRSSTQSSTKPMDKSMRRDSTSPTPRWKRLSNILAQPRRNS
jgi:hypothetical protein